MMHQSLHLSCESSADFGNLFMLACFDLSQVTFCEALIAFYLYSLAGCGTKLQYHLLAPLCGTGVSLEKCIRQSFILYLLFFF